MQAWNGREITIRKSHQKMGGVRHFKDKFTRERILQGRKEERKKKNIASLFYEGFEETTGVGATSAVEEGTAAGSGTIPMRGTDTEAGC